MSNFGPGIPPSHSRVSLAVLMQNREANLWAEPPGSDLAGRNRPRRIG